MPTTAKSTAQYATLGDLSTYNVSTTAIPVDTADSSGSIPTVSATFTDGTEPENLIGEIFTVTSPTVGKYDGEIVSVSKSVNSSRYSIDVHSIMNRLNTEHRVYPLSDYIGTQTTWLPYSTLEYWTQQCGVFMRKLDGDVIFYQSQFGHYGAWAKGVTRLLKSGIFRYSGSDAYTARESFDGRLMNNMPRDSAAYITLPGKLNLTDMGSYPAVLIPPVASPDVMVFGSNVKLDGTGRQGSFKFILNDAKGVKRYLMVEISAASGFVLYTSDNGTVWATRGSVAATNGDYVFYVGATSVPGGTKFDMNVVKPDSSLLGSSTTTVPDSPIKDSMALAQIVYTGANSGSGEHFLYSDTFIAKMKALPTAWPEYQKDLYPDPESPTTDFAVGFSGNVWEHIKQYCSIYRIDINYLNGKLTARYRQKNIKVGASLSELSTQVQDREKARHVEVVNQQHKPTGNAPKVLWAADQVYQVAVGEVQEFVVQTPHSIASVVNPICVNGITPYPYVAGTGQYVVTGSDGYIVAPAFWNDQGGSITVDVTENDGEIKVRIKGPDFDSTRAPYRISEGDAGRPALYVTGEGVKADPKTLKVPTGNSKAAKDIGTTLDSPFIGNTKQAFDAAFNAAKAFATPAVTVSFAEPYSYDEVSKLGVAPAGALAKVNGNIVRVTDASQTPSTVSGTASQHNTIYQLKRSFGTGAKIADMNDFNDGRPIGKVNLKPLKVVK